MKCLEMQLDGSLQQEEQMELHIQGFLFLTSENILHGGVEFLSNQVAQGCRND